MFKALSRLVSRRPPLPVLNHGSINTLCQTFLPQVQALNRQQLNTIQQQSAPHPPLYREDSMNLYQRASLYLEYGEWHKARQLLDAAAQRLQAHAPDAATPLLHLCRDMQAAELHQRELLRD